MRFIALLQSLQIADVQEEVSRSVKKDNLTQARLALQLLVFLPPAEPAAAFKRVGSKPCHACHAISRCHNLCVGVSQVQSGLLLQQIAPSMGLAMID